MDYTLYIIDYNIVDANILVGLGLLGALMLLSCSCCSAAPKATPLTIAEKNSKLAFMLMLILLEHKEDNRKYIKMAEGIGYDHIIGPCEFLDADSDSD